MALLIGIGKRPIEIQPMNGTDFQLLGCSMVERIVLNKKDVMWLDEEGKITNKPFNSLATALFKKSIGHTDDYIVGSVLICDYNEVL